MADGSPLARRYIPVAAIPQASSYVDPTLVYTTLFAVAPGNPGDPDPLLQLAMLDPLDPKFTAALLATASLGPAVYYGEPITTLAHEHYRTTSAWALVVAFNGYLHPDEIPSGVSLELPDIDGFLKAYQAEVRKVRRKITF